MMGYIMHRSFADHMGFNWPKEIAFVENGRRVTWAELKAARISRQKENLQKITDIRSGPVRHAAYLWVFYQPGIFGFAYMGWWLYIRTLNRDWCFNFREFEAGLKTVDIMSQFPCGFLPLKENYEKWKPAFARQYWRPGRFPKQGLLPGWIECEHEGGWPQTFTACASIKGEMNGARKKNLR